MDSMAACRTKLVSECQDSEVLFCLIIHAQCTFKNEEKTPQECMQTHQVYLLVENIAFYHMTVTPCSFHDKVSAQKKKIKDKMIIRKQHFFHGQKK